VADVVKRSFSFVLLALHLLVFVIAGALAAESSAMASGGRSVPGARVVVTTATDGSTAIASPDGRRSELGTRARGDRGDSGSSDLSLALVLPPTHASIGPAELVAVRDWRSFIQGHRSLPCVVNGARGPPPGR
jgi:hypothetical protein